MNQNWAKCVYTYKEYDSGLALLDIQWVPGKQNLNK